jgi:hypothetical protein
MFCGNDATIAADGNDATIAADGNDATIAADDFPGPGSVLVMYVNLCS